MHNEDNNWKANKIHATAALRSDQTFLPLPSNTRHSDLACAANFSEEGSLIKKVLTDPEGYRQELWSVHNTLGGQAGSHLIPKMQWHRKKQDTKSQSHDYDTMYPEAFFFH